MSRGPDDHLRETLVERETVHSGDYLSLLRDVVSDAAGERHAREVVVHPGAICVVALRDDGQILLVRQYRHAVGEVCLELPAGTLDRGDDGSTEDPDAAARRELAEETGHRAGAWRKLATFYTAPGFATEVMHLYLATDLAPIDGYAGPAPDERLELQPMHWTDALRLAEEGRLRDAKTLVGVLWLARLAQTQDQPPLRGG